MLSVGCGWGETEKALIDKGMRVKAIPIDSVIAVNAEARGVEIVYGDGAKRASKLGNERFDCILFSNVLHLVEPRLNSLGNSPNLLAPERHVIASAPNVIMVRLLARRLSVREDGQSEGL